MALVLNPWLFLMDALLVMLVLLLLFIIWIFFFDEALRSK